MVNNKNQHVYIEISHYFHNRMLSYSLYSVGVFISVTKKIFSFKTNGFQTEDVAQ
jgi:hypothetical protein